MTDGSGACGEALDKTADESFVESFVESLDYTGRRRFLRPWAKKGWSKHICMREVQKKSERYSMCERDRSGGMCLCVRETTFTLLLQVGT